MKVKLLTSTPDPEHTILTGYLNCQNRSLDIPFKLDEIPDEERFKRIFKDGHFSVLEHASATVRISDVSRSLLAQLTRHRLFSYSVRSMRTVHASLEDTVIPRSVKERGMEIEFNGALKHAHFVYNTMIDAGVPLEDARFILPLGTKTEIVMTGNFRNWIHFLRERSGLKGKPQWEIQAVAQAIWRTLSDIAPNVFNTEYTKYWE